MTIERMASCDSATIETKRIARNSAEAAYNKANTDYESCLPLNDRIEEAFARVKPTADAITKEANQLEAMGKFLLRQMQQDTGSDASVEQMKAMAQGEIKGLQEEIEELKAQIRKERRVFLDSDPQVSPAVAGLYFTKVPDNRVLIAFLTAFGGFLLIMSLLIILNHLPFQYFQNMTMAERLKIVAGGWVGSFVLMYIGFMTFT